MGRSEVQGCRQAQMGCHERRRTSGRGTGSALAFAGWRALVPLALVAALSSGWGCGAPAAADFLPIGLLISFTGRQGANGFNSERALLLAVEAANRGGGADGRPFQVLARDTRSDPRKIEAPARELIDAGS